MVNYKIQTLNEKKIQRMFKIESCYAEVAVPLIAGAKLISGKLCAPVLSD